MVGNNGWCVNYDTGKRICRIYQDRPDFCKVANLPHLFNVDSEQADRFAITCCTQQIKSIYGGKSTEMKRFKKSIRTI